MPDVLDHDAVTAALAGLADWCYFDDSLHARFDAPDFLTAIRLVDRVAAAAEELDHHPDIDLRWKKVTFVLSTHSAGGVTEYDLTLAGRITEMAKEVEASPLPASLRRVEIAIDCMDASAIQEFWRVGLQLETMTTHEGAHDLVDPSGSLPAVSFQRMSEPRTDRNRLHINVYVPRDQAQDRVAALLAVGGRLVTDQHAPSWWVMADAEGNELCVCA